MAHGNYEYQSDFAKKHYNQGWADGWAEALLTVLDARGIVVTDAQRARVLSTLDAAMLRTWLTRAATFDSAEEVFSD